MGTVLFCGATHSAQQQTVQWQVQTQIVSVNGPLVIHVDVIITTSTEIHTQDDIHI